MPGTLILVFHRDLAASRANSALAAAARTLPRVEIVDMQARYPEARIDLDTDAARDAQMLLNADRIVLQFPIQWYSTPSLLKSWQDAVLTRMYYLEREAEGDRLAGTPMMIAATAGNIPAAYARGGQNHFTIDEILTPLKATAYRCDLPWHPPHLVFTADRLSDEALSKAADDYRRALAGFIAATSSKNPTHGIV
ncbi:flavodoxin family protein [Georhizobium profundi]|uniref:Flavodoxin family protein n=1 Tax=Georhizobium profundi TaxID=2341112 RepID=A0A3Q8XSQ1_9HYPH|nr:NAD(P)H-dependent oxidoreductase [Georhizobium profundi]AZN72889.1 flavodoxin family protein [Georhizobium profundi]